MWPRHVGGVPVARHIWAADWPGRVYLGRIAYWGYDLGQLVWKIRHEDFLLDIVFCISGAIDCLGISPFRYKGYPLASLRPHARPLQASGTHNMNPTTSLIVLLLAAFSAAAPVPAPQPVRTSATCNLDSPNVIVGDRRCIS